MINRTRQGQDHRRTGPTGDPGRDRVPGVGRRRLSGPNESPHFIDDLDTADIPYVVTVNPNTSIPAGSGDAVTPVQAARQTTFTSRSRPGKWRRITHRHRDGHTQTWWATELTLNRDGPRRTHRLIVASNDPQALPATSTWYLSTSLPRRPTLGRRSPKD